MILDDILDGLDTGVMVVNKNLSLVYVNQWIKKRTEREEYSNLYELFPKELLSKRLNDAINTCLTHNLPSVITPILNKYPIPLVKLSDESKVKIIPYIKITPFYQEDESYCMLQISDVTSVMVREEFFSSKSKKLSKIALTDELTNIPNRRYFNKHLTELFEKSSDKISKITLLFIDVDFFKKYNDFYGHQKGDECLIKISGIISHTAKRANCKAFRYGGEEFCIIAHNLDDCNIENLTEAIIDNISKSNIKHDDSVYKKLTVSIGVSSYVSGSEQTQASLISKADSALYHSKDKGRNTFTIL